MIAGILLLGSQAARLQAAAITWDGGAGDGRWSSAANWSGDQLPAASDSVILPASSGGIHVDGAVTAAGDLEIGSGTTLVVDSGVALTLGFLFGAGALYNHGTIQEGAASG